MYGLSDDCQEMSSQVSRLKKSNKILSTALKSIANGTGSAEDKLTACQAIIKVQDIEGKEKE